MSSHRWIIYASIHYVLCPQHRLLFVFISLLSSTLRLVTFMSNYNPLELLVSPVTPPVLQNAAASSFHPPTSPHICPRRPIKYDVKREVQHGE